MHILLLLLLSYYYYFAIVIKGPTRPELIPTRSRRPDPTRTNPDPIPTARPEPKKRPRECGALDLIYTGAVYLCCKKPTAARRLGLAHSLQAAQVIPAIRCAGHIVTGKPPAVFLIGVRPTTTAIGKP